MPVTAVNKRSKLIFYFGFGLLASGLVLTSLVFYPVVREEVKYQVITKNQPPAEVVPVDRGFGIVIPKIGANARVLANVDPYNEKEYQWQLTKGVAQARGTVFPGQIGNTFIFAHSAGDILEANRFNAVFYLLYKLSPGDEVDLYYKGDKFKYLVIESKYVDAAAVSYLSAAGPDKTLTLMTCWPPGTTLKRLIVIAKMSTSGL